MSTEYNKLIFINGLHLEAQHDEQKGNIIEGVVINDTQSIIDCVEGCAGGQLPEGCPLKDGNFLKLKFPRIADPTEIVNKQLKNAVCTSIDYERY